jgi:hypothetical protein
MNKVIKLIKKYTIGTKSDNRVRRTNGTIARRVIVKDYGKVTGCFYL